MKSTVGISHRLKRAWLDDLLDRLVQTQDEKELRAFVDQRLRDELPGKDARAKAAGILLRIWCRVDAKHMALRDRAVALLPGISGQERIWLHWGMAALAYPFFRDLAEVIGRMLTLQDDITNAQVQSRLKTAWGDRETSKEAAGKLITSMVDWEVLRATKTKGHFLLARKMTTSVTELQMWLLEAMLSASASDEIEAQQLLRLPELFPFALTVGVGNLRKHEGFNIHRQGLDMDMVSTRHVKVEPPATLPRANKSKKKELPQPKQPSFFEEPPRVEPPVPDTPPIPTPWMQLQDDSKWTRIRAAYPKFNGHLRVIGDGLAAVFGGLESAFTRENRALSEADLAVYGLGRIAAEDILEIVVLCENGLGVAGIKLLRGLYERVLTAEVLSKNKSQATAFFQCYFVDAMKFGNRGQTVYGTQWKEAKGDRMSEIKASYDLIKNNYKAGNCASCGKPIQLGWTQKSLETMAESVGGKVKDAYLLMASLPNALIHASMFGIFQRLRVGKDGAFSFQQDQEEQVGFVLSCVHSLVPLLLATQDRYFSLGLAEPIATIGAGFHNAWRPEGWSDEH